MIKGRVSEIVVDLIDYPKLMKHQTSGSVVLFHKAGTGIIVASNSKNPTGLYDRTWNMSNFEDFKGTVTLKNCEDTL